MKHIDKQPGIFSAKSSASQSTAELFISSNIKSLILVSFITQFLFRVQNKISSYIGLFSRSILVLNPGHIPVSIGISPPVIAPYSVLVPISIPSSVHISPNSKHQGPSWNNMHQIVSQISY